MIIHLIHYPVSEKIFVEPVVKFLNENGFNTELWLEKRTDLNDFIDSIECPKQYAEFDLSLNPFKTLIRLSLLIKRFKKNKPSVIHAHQSRAALIPLIAARITKVPVRIYHNHGAPYLGYKEGNTDGKVKHNGQTGASILLMEYPGCRVTLRGNLDEANHTRVLHPVQPVNPVPAEDPKISYASEFTAKVGLYLNQNQNIHIGRKS